MRDFIRTIQGRIAAVAGTLAVSATPAIASTSGTGGGNAVSSSGFDDFEASVLSWINGPLGVGLAVTSLMVGGGVGIMQATPMPAIAGLALAAFFAWGPSVIVSLVSGGAMVG